MLVKWCRKVSFLCRDIKIIFFKLKSKFMKALAMQALMLVRMLQNYHADFLGFMSFSKSVKLLCFYLSLEDWAMQGSE